MFSVASFFRFVFASGLVVDNSYGLEIYPFFSYNLSNFGEANHFWRKVQFFCFQLKTLKHLTQNIHSAARAEKVK